jgi:FkbM family methyltransferase
MRSLAKEIAYGALDLCTGFRGIPRRISGEQIRFPARWCRYYPGDYEPDKFAFLRAHTRPGHHVLDIGAHIGLFSVVLSRLVGPRGRVFSFEPTPHLRATLHDTVRMNSCEHNVTIHGEALSATTGHAVFHDTGEVGSNANSLVESARSARRLDVATVSVDDFAATHHIKLDVLKIDAEGAELSILEGARETLTSSRPAVQLEVHPAQIERSGRSLEEMWGLLDRHRMVVWHGGRQVDRDWFCGLVEGTELQLLPTEAR